MINDRSQFIASVPRETRIEFLDALRGLAILLVFLFHTYSRWPDIVPYGNQFAKIPLFAFGWLGVQLFFLISGFVIFMTLEKSTGPFDFLKRRWLRLFPGMLICSLIIYATSPLFPYRPSGMIQPRDLLPGLTFIEPFLWGKILGSPQGLIEGAFWSLFVEVKFYIVASLLYFVIGGRKMIFVFVAMFLAVHGLERLPSLVTITPLQWVITRMQQFGEIASMKQFGWFAAGALFYRYFHERTKVLLWYALGLSLIAAFTMAGRDLEEIAAATLMIILFASAIYFPLLQHVLSIKPLLLMGVISYPFYLMHENMSVSMIVQLNKAAPWIPPIALPLLPMCVVITAAYIIATYSEPYLRNAMKATGHKIRFQFRAKAAL